MKIDYIGPIKCAKCGRELPVDRDCPRCESGPWWPIVAAFFVCGLVIGGLVYMAVHPRKVPVFVMQDVKPEAAVQSGAQQPLPGDAGLFPCFQPSGPVRKPDTYTVRFTALSADPKVILNGSGDLNVNTHVPSPVKRILVDGEEIWPHDMRVQGIGDSGSFGGDSDFNFKFNPDDLPLCIETMLREIGVFCKSLDGKAWQWTKDGWKNYEVRP